jgi:hypothetical protein
MTKKVMNTEEVKVAREEGVKKVFNLTLALEMATDTAPKATKSGAHGDFSTNLVSLLRAAGGPLFINQIVAGLNAAGMNVTSKNVADRAWLLSDKNSKNKAPLLKGGVEKGSYQIA